MVTNSLDGNAPTTDQQHNLPIQVSLLAGSTYEYIPLPGLDWLRLLTPMPGKENNKLQCRIHALPILEAEDAYEAVSYTWGDSRKTASIICHDRELPITNNLANALKQLHDPTKPRLLWIDAICINQGDGIEKGHQVKRMGNIYQSDKRVIVWLSLYLEEIAQDSFQLVQETNRYLDGLYEKSKDGPHG